MQTFHSQQFAFPIVSFQFKFKPPWTNLSANFTRRAKLTSRRDNDEL